MFVSCLFTSPAPDNLTPDKSLDCRARTAGKTVSGWSCKLLLNDWCPFLNKTVKCRQTVVEPMQIVHSSNTSQPDRVRRSNWYACVCVYVRGCIHRHTYARARARTCTEWRKSPLALGVFNMWHAESSDSCVTLYRHTHKHARTCVYLQTTNLLFNSPGTRKNHARRLWRYHNNICWIRVEKCLDLLYNMPPFLIFLFIRRYLTVNLNRKRWLEYI